MATFPPALAPPPRPKNWFARHPVLGILALAALAFVLLLGFAGGILYAVEYSFKRSDVYNQALAEARKSPELAGKLGQPLEPGWFISGNINLNGTSGEASLSTPISAPKGKGTLYIVASKSAGKWHFETLEVEIDGESQRIDLLQSRKLGPAE